MKVINENLTIFKPTSERMRESGKQLQPAVVATADAKSRLQSENSIPEDERLKTYQTTLFVY